MNKMLLILFLILALMGRVAIADSPRSLLAATPELAKKLSSDLREMSGIDSKWNKKNRDHEDYLKRVRKLERDIEKSVRWRAVHVDVDKLSLSELKGKRKLERQFSFELFPGESVELQIDDQVPIVQSGDLIAFTGKLENHGNKILPIDIVRIFVNLKGTITTEPFVYKDRFYVIRPVVEYKLDRKTQVPHVVYEFDPATEEPVDFRAAHHNDLIAVEPAPEGEPLNMSEEQIKKLHFSPEKYKNSQGAKVENE